MNTLKQNEEIEDINSIIDVEFIDEMKESYLDFSNVVIKNRAIPSIDGMKCGQRRALFSMYDSGNVYSSKLRKCARIIGEVTGKYHPHGESSVYETIVALAQPFSSYIPLVQGHGNFGSVGGDEPAAARYTEARLSYACGVLIKDLKYSSVVPYSKNYDGTLTEPNLLPCSFPILLVNGSNGIAVGFVSVIPSHIPQEVFEVCKYILSKEDYMSVTFDEIKHLISGPDFNMFCLIDTTNLEEIYRDGIGVLTVRSKLEIIDNYIVIKGLPKFIDKIRLLKSICRAVEEKQLFGVEDIIDESIGDDISIKVICDPVYSLNVIVNRIYKYTLCTHYIGCVFRVIVDGLPLVLSFDGICKEFIKFRIDVIKKRLMEEIKDYFDNIERIVAIYIVSSSQSILEAITNIIESSNIDESRIKLGNMEFDISNIASKLPNSLKKSDPKKFKLTSVQIEYMLNISIKKLNKGNISDIEKQIEAYSQSINEKSNILMNENAIRKMVIDDMESFINAIGKVERKCTLVSMATKTNIRELEDKKEVVLILGRKNKIACKLLSIFKEQKKGGKGKDISSDGNYCILYTTTHENIMLFSKLGKVYKINVFNIYYEGESIEQICMLSETDEIVWMTKDLDSNVDKIAIVTRKGCVKQHSASTLKIVTCRGKTIFNLSAEDYLLYAVLYKNNDLLGLFTKLGKYIIIDSAKLSDTKSFNSKGVIGIKLKEGDSMYSLVVITQDVEGILIVSNSGYGKIIPRTEFSRVRSRNTVGITCLNIKQARLGAILTIMKDCTSAFIVTSFGKIIMFDVKTISHLSRKSKGVRLIQLDQDDTVVAGGTDK